MIEVYICYTTVFVLATVLLSSRGLLMPTDTITPKEFKSVNRRIMNRIIIDRISNQ